MTWWKGEGHPPNRWVNVCHLGRRGPVPNFGLGSLGEPCDSIQVGEHGENFSEFRHHELTIVRFVPSLGRAPSSEWTWHFPRDHEKITMASSKYEY